MSEEKEKTVADLVKPIAALSNETRQLIKVLYKENPEAAVCAIIMVMAETFGLVWHDTKPKGQAILLNELFGYLELQAETYEKMEKNEENIKNEENKNDE